MSVAAKIAGFTAMLVAVFVGAAFAGAEVDPDIEGASKTHAGAEQMEQHETGGGAEAVPGLAVAEGGYRLVPDRTELAGSNARFAFRIVDAGGQTVSDFDTEHARRMHLIVVRRDFVNFQHVHPAQLADGSWEAEVDLDPSGVYRAFADFSTEGRSLTLATDLFAAGSFRPAPLPPVEEVADASDGYEVSLDSAGAEAGGSTPVSFTVRKDGQEVRSVEPYLGADGHLVALREHDQAFLHTHPEGEPGGSGPISFDVEYPTEGRYRLFLQFRHRGQVRTAAFTQEVRETAELRSDPSGLQEPSSDHGEEAGNGH